MAVVGGCPFQLLSPLGHRSEGELFPTAARWLWPGWTLQGFPGFPCGESSAHSTPRPSPATSATNSGARQCRLVASLPWSLPSQARLWEGGPWPAMLPFYVWQVDCCGRSQRQVHPEPVTSRVKQTSSPHLSRVNGWSKPMHTYQVISWVVFLILALAMYAVFIPMLPIEGKYITYRVSFYWGSTCLLS